MNKDIINKLEREYEKLEQYVLDNEADKDCSKELKRMNTIQNEIAREAHHKK